MGTELLLSLLLLAPAQPEQRRTVPLLHLFEKPVWSADALGASRLTQMKGQGNWPERAGKAIASGDLARAFELLSEARPGPKEQLAWAYTLANVAKAGGRLQDVLRRKGTGSEDELARAFAQVLRSRPSPVDPSRSAAAARQLTPEDTRAIQTLMKRKAQSAEEAAAQASALIQAQQFIMARELLYKWNESRRGSPTTHLMDAMLQRVSVAAVRPQRDLWPWEREDTLRRDQLLQHVRKDAGNWAPALGYQVAFVRYASRESLRADLRRYLSTADALERKTVRFLAVKQVQDGLGP